MSTRKIFLFFSPIKNPHVPSSTYFSCHFSSLTEGNITPRFLWAVHFSFMWITWLQDWKLLISSLNIHCLKNYLHPRLICQFAGASWRGEFWSNTGWSRTGCLHQWLLGEQKWHKSSNQSARKGLLQANILFSFMLTCALKINKLKESNYLFIY